MRQFWRGFMNGLTGKQILVAVRTDGRTATYVFPDYTTHRCSDTDDADQPECAEVNQLAAAMVA